MEALKDAIKNLVWAGKIEAGMLQVMINSRHQEALGRAREATLRTIEALRADASLELVALDLRIAVNAVGEIVGKTTTDDLLDSIFSQFCLGNNLGNEIDSVCLSWHNSPMRRRHVSLSPVIDRAIESQVKLGRYKDFSAAMQDAAWNYFIGPASPFEEYGVTPKQVESAYAKVLAEIKDERRAGKLRPWHP